jgi:hypothetical protein
VNIESPKHLPEINTGFLREHDVVLTIKNGHHTLIVAIECRDRSRPVGRPQLEAFAKKCERTGINQGIMVSPCGFIRKAPEIAHELGLRCLSLDQVEELPWLLCDDFHLFKISYGYFELYFIPEHELDKELKDYKIEIDDGKEIALGDIKQNILSFLKDDVLNEVIHKSDKQEKNILKRSLIPTNLTVCDRDTGQKEKIVKLLVIVHYSINLTKIPFTRSIYKEMGSTESLAEIATAKIEFGSLSGQFVIKHKFGEGGEMVFIKEG